LVKEDLMELIIKGEPFLLHDTLLGAPYPGALSFEATNFCNLCCTHCGHSQYPGFSKGHFDMKYFRKVEHLLGSEVKSISLNNFGEPFMSKTWDDLLHRSLSLDSPAIFFITNGLLLDRHIEEVLNPRISMAISIDGASEQTYSSFRGRNNFQKLMFNLTLLKDTKLAKGIPYPQVTFLFTVSRVNCDDLPRIVDMAAALGVGGVIIQFQIFYHAERFRRESLFFAREDYDSNIAAARLRASALGIDFIHPNSFDGRSMVPPEILAGSWLGRDSAGKIRCGSQATVCYVKYNGVIEACCTPDHNIMGSLDLDTFEDIWHGPHYRELRLTLDRGIWPDRCKCCSLIQVVDVHDERAHFTKVPAACFDKKPAPQRYRITEVDRLYREALSFLPHDPDEVCRMLPRLLDIDENLYEVHNMKACLDGLRGDFQAMLKGLEKCAAIAPGDLIVTKNCSKALHMSRLKSI
jgi:MoaA/NifB/PqqE/SkfB family radical SAM enzyme